MRTALIADSHALLADEVKEIVAELLDDYVIYVVNRGQQFHQRLRKQPEILILDMNFLGVSLEESVNIVTEFSPNSRIIFMGFDRQALRGPEVDSLSKVVVGAFDKSKIYDELPPLLEMVNQLY